MNKEKRINPWGSEDIEDYQNLFKEFGIESFDKFRNKFSDNRYMRRGIVFGHRDFKKISDAIEKKKPFVMMTGLMPSGKFHFGHKMVADQIIWYQKIGAKLYVCVADMEAYLTRDINQKTAIKLAIEEYLINYLALGLKKKNLYFYFQGNHTVPYYRFRDTLSRKTTFNELQAIYGDLTPGKILSVLTQVADILHPQLDEFEGPIATVVPVGADQDPHMRLTRDIASKFQNEFKFILPSSTYHKFMHGLQEGKMSSSDPKSFIALTDDFEIVRKKIIESKTGGRSTVKEQKEKGGVPEDCMVYELFLYHLVDDDNELEELYRECKSGELSCGNCKEICIEMMIKFLKEHQKKREKVRKAVERILER